MYLDATLCGSCCHVLTLPRRRLEVPEMGVSTIHQISVLQMVFSLGEGTCAADIHFFPRIPDIRTVSP